MLHGREAAEKAALTAQKTFETGTIGGDLPSVTIPKNQLNDGAPLLEQFIATGLCASKGEGRRHIKAGALKINNQAIREERPLNPDDIQDGVIKLSIGKKKHALVRLEA